MYKILLNSYMCTNWFNDVARVKTVQFTFEKTKANRPHVNFHDSSFLCKFAIGI